MDEKSGEHSSVKPPLQWLVLWRLPWTVFAGFAGKSTTSTWFSTGGETGSLVRLQTRAPSAFERSLATVETEAENPSSILIVVPPDTLSIQLFLGL
jgi:hypothetical protein